MLGSHHEGRNSDTSDLFQFYIHRWQEIKSSLLATPPDEIHRPLHLALNILGSDLGGYIDENMLNMNLSIVGAGRGVLSRTGEEEVRRRPPGWGPSNGVIVMFRVTGACLVKISESGMF